MSPVHSSLEDLYISKPQTDGKGVELISELLLARCSDFAYFLSECPKQYRSPLRRGPA